MADYKKRIADKILAEKSHGFLFWNNHRRN